MIFFGVILMISRDMLGSGGSMSVERLGGAADLHAPDPPRIDRGDVVHDEGDRAAPCRTFLNFFVAPSGTRRW